MEKLHRLATRQEDQPDLIVLDTPPATHALDFLEAPNRIVDALDNDATRWILQPYTGRKRLSRRVLDAGSSLFIRTIARFTGIELLEELAELLTAFSSMFDGFRERARAVKALLARPDTLFCIVGSPTPTGLQDVRAFADKLSERDVHLSSIVLNRTATNPFQAGEPAPEALRKAVESAGGSSDLSRRLEANAAFAQAEASRQAEAAARLARDIPRCSVVSVPELRRDVHDLGSLDLLRANLF